MTAPECWGAAVAVPAQPPLASGLPVSWCGGQAGEPPRKVQLAVWAEDRAVTKAVLRAGESREEGGRCPGGAAWGPGGRGRAPGPGSCGHSLQVALQLAHGGLVQGEEVEVEGGVGDIEVTSLLDQVHDLEGGDGVASGNRG